MTKPAASSDVFRAIADPSRRRMLDEMRAGERTVGALTALLGVSQPTVSQHLTILRDTGLVRARREGRNSVYALEAARLTEIADWLSHYTAFWHARIGALDAYLDREVQREDDLSPPEPKQGDPS